MNDDRRAILPQSKLSTQEIKERRKKAAKIIRVLKKLYPDARVFLNSRTPWQLLVAVILSAQCTDKKVNEVTKNLFKKYKTLDDYINASPRIFSRDIYATGFYRTKTAHILNAAKRIKEVYKGKVPRTMNDLVSLPGVGRKTANIILESSFGIVEGIPVDTHVIRLAHVLGLSSEKNPKNIEADLLAIIPKKDLPNFSYRLISYGREYCPARAHAHAKCPLSKL